MKECNCCGEIKDLSEYYKHSLANDGLEPRCKTCKVLVAKRRRQERKLKAIAMHGDVCSVCNKSFPPCVYDFHHTNSDKEVSPGKARSDKAFFEEVSKCVMVCSNCHRVIHFDQDEEEL